MKAPKPLIALKRVTFGYEPGADVIRNLSLNIHPGDRYVFVGPNGAGKTTLVNLLAGVLIPQRGRIEYHPDMEPRQGRRPIACVRQNLSVFPTLTVLEHFRLLDPAKESPADVPPDRRTPEQILSQVGARFAPSSRVGELPFSSQQLLEIALALWQRARVLILDEPTSALDLAAGAALLRTLDALAHTGVAIILVSHHAHDIARLKAKKVMLGKPAQSREPGSGWWQPVHAGPGQTGPRMARLPVGDAKAVEVPTSAGAVVVLNFDDALQRSTAWLMGTDPDCAGELHRGFPAGIRAISTDREKFGIFPSLSATQNYQLLSGLANVPPRDALARFGIVLPSWAHNVSALSGGNQQKLVLGSILAAHPDMVLAEEPLLGLDGVAKENVAESFRSYLQHGGRLTVYTCFPEAYRELQPTMINVPSGHHP